MSMSIYAYKLEGKRYGFVFPESWTTEETYPEGFDWGRYINDDDYGLAPIKNPNYRPELHLNLSNSNMVYLMYGVLGFTDEEWIERNEDEVIYSFLVPVDIFLTKTQVWLQKHMGSVTPALETYEHPRRMERQVRGNVVDLEPTPVGPQVFDCGRREGYDEETVYKMVLIAQEGKECGATHIGAT